MMRDPNSKSFREHVVAVAERRDRGVTLHEIADDFGLNAATLRDWMRADPLDADSLETRPEPASVESLDVAELEWRVEQEKLLLGRIVERLARLDP